MMIEELKERVCRANQDLSKYNLVALTWGNVSGFDRDQGLVVIKPSGLDYAELTPSNMVVVNLDGRRVEGKLNPSSDTPAHLELYKSFKKISGATHTHSEYAAMFAQAGREIPCLGTTHADHFNGDVPLTRMISRDEVEKDYEANTGKVIVERFAGLDPLQMPAVLVHGHGAFTWGRSPEEAVLNSRALESVAKMAWGSLLIGARRDQFPEYLMQKHFQRKHGSGAYYGQKKKGAKK